MDAAYPVGESVDDFIPAADAAATVGKAAQTIIKWIGPDGVHEDEYRQDGRFYFFKLAAVKRVAATKRPPRSSRATDHEATDELERLRSEVSVLRVDLARIAAERDQLSGAESAGNLSGGSGAPEVAPQPDLLDRVSVLDEVARRHRAIDEVRHLIEDGHRQIEEHYREIEALALGPSVVPNN